MFKKILIANRGAIACRILRTVKRMGIGSVAVYSEADENSMHVRLADEALLHRASAGRRKLSARRAHPRSRARSPAREGIHPGYGFLSENADFAQMCEDAGVAFIGPTPAQMRDFGLKHTARELARRAGLPLLPGTELLGGSAGGARGGGDDRLSGDAEEHCRRRRHRHAPLQFVAGTARVIRGRAAARGRQLPQRRCVPREVRGARAAYRGAVVWRWARHVIALGERDCSVQRRNQKVIEESPAPGLDSDARRELHDAARRLGRVGGISIGGYGGVRVRRRAREVLLPRGEHAPAGGAWRHRRSRRHRPGGVDDPHRGRRAAGSARASS